MSTKKQRYMAAYRAANRRKIARKMALYRKANWVKLSRAKKSYYRANRVRISKRRKAGTRLASLVRRHWPMILAELRPRVSPTRLRELRQLFHSL
jgi:hypothetical protein